MASPGAAQHGGGVSRILEADVDAVSTGDHVVAQRRYDQAEVKVAENMHSVTGADH